MFNDSGIPADHIRSHTITDAAGRSCLCKHPGPFNHIIGLETGYLGNLFNRILLHTLLEFIKTDCPDGMKYFERRKPEFQIDSDFDTENAKFKATFRGSWGCTDKRGIFGSPGA